MHTTFAWIVLVTVISCARAVDLRYSSSASIARLPFSTQAGPSPNAILQMNSAPSLINSRKNIAYRASTWQRVNGGSSDYFVRRTIGAPFYNEVHYAPSSTNLDQDRLNGMRDFRDRRYAYNTIGVYKILDGNAQSFEDIGIFIAGKLPISQNDLFGQDTVIVRDRYLITTSNSLQSSSGVAILVFDMQRSTLDRFVSPVFVIDSADPQSQLPTLPRASDLKIAINSFTRNSGNFCANGVSFQFNGEDTTGDLYTPNGSCGSLYNASGSIMRQYSTLDTLVNTGGDRGFATSDIEGFGPFTNRRRVDLDESDGSVLVTDLTNGKVTPIRGTYCHIFSTTEYLYLASPWNFASTQPRTLASLPKFYRISWINYNAGNLGLVDVTQRVSQFGEDQTILEDAAKAAFTVLDNDDQEISFNITSGCDMIVDVNKATDSLVVFSELGHLLEIQNTPSPRKPRFTTKKHAPAPYAGLSIVPAKSTKPIIKIPTTSIWITGSSKQTAVGRFFPHFPSPFLFSKADSLYTSAGQVLYEWKSSNSYLVPTRAYKLGSGTKKTTLHLTYNPYRYSWVEKDLLCKTKTVDEVKNDDAYFTRSRGPTVLPLGINCGVDACAVADAGNNVYCRKYVTSPAEDDRLWTDNPLSVTRMGNDNDEFIIEAEDESFSVHLTEFAY